MRQKDFSYGFDASACSSCGGRCCTGESGNIFVNVTEIQALCELLDMDVQAFKTRYLEKRGYKYSLKERQVSLSYDCIFFDRTLNGCSVYDARPKQCRTFPFWDYYKTRVDELKHECPGVVNA